MRYLIPMIIGWIALVVIFIQAIDAPDSTAEGIFIIALTVVFGLLLIVDVSLDLYEKKG